MNAFIVAHTIIGFVLILLGVVTAFFPQTKRSFVQSLIARIFFLVLLLVAVSGIVIGIYRHPTSISVFQIVTVIGIVFAGIGLLAEMGKMENVRGKSNTFWYINGLGGSLIATGSASLFFLALTYFKDFYQANIVWLSIVFIGLPVIIGREFIKKKLQKK